MGNPRNEATKCSTESKEVHDIEIFLEPVTVDKEKYVVPIPLFNESSFVFWKGIMEAYLRDIGHYVWDSLVSGNTSNMNQENTIPRP